MPMTFETEQWLPYPAEELFAFFTNPSNLPSLMPDWQHARVETVRVVPPARTSATRPQIEAAGPGSRITLSFRPFPGCPIRTSWEAEITEFSWNTSFRDIQIRGPFAYWQHTHHLRSVDRAGIGVTVIFDRVEYEPPLGSLGKLAHGLIERQISKIFEFRHRRLAEIFAQREQRGASEPPHHAQAS